VKRSLVVVSLCALATLSGTAFADGAFNVQQPEAAPAPASVVAVAKGSMVVSANGSRLATVYRVSPDGSAQIILDGKMVTIPASTLSVAGGRVTTSLTKSEVLALH
jgi:hypothetical protein